MKLTISNEIKIKMVYSKKSKKKKRIFITPTKANSKYSSMKIKQKLLEICIEKSESN